ncbi:MAG: YciI family protein [Polyangiaceae bacterium]|nr:YciI family protein [Polyangiaceae bacterium]
MTKYLFLYRNPPSPDYQPSPEEMQKMFAQWNAWKEKFKAQVVDVGDGLKHGAKLLANGKVSDGPLPEAKEIIGGFSIIQAQTIDDAIAVARECPIVYMPNSVIEIREMMGF